MQKTSNLFILNVQFCKSCDTHNWCTHHDEQKYLGTYRKLKQYLQKQFGSDIFIQGNVIPQQLVPIKPAENKYFNTKTNKYATFPAIGAFQVMLQNQLIFSKKKTNTWPNFGQIADKVYEKINGKQRQRSPTRKNNTFTNVDEKTQCADADIKTQKDNVSVKNQSFLDHTDKRSTFYKTRPQQNKNFTLTDHFKNYHNGNYKNPVTSSKRASDEYFTTSNTDNENQMSEISSFRNGGQSEKDFLEFKKNFEMFGLEGKLPQFFKKKGYLKEDLGKKEMIIRLDSIEEQSILVDDNNQSYSQNVNLINTHSTFKSKSKDSHKRLMKRFTDDFEQLQAKFKKFQQKVENIREENKKFDQRDSSTKINDKILKQLNEIKKKQKRLRSSQMKENLDDETEDMEMMDNPIIFARKKLKNIEDYINGTQEEKNQKLKKIYGEWKLLKKPYKGKSYISPYKMQVNKRIGGSKNQYRQENQHTHFSSSEQSSDQQTTQHLIKPISKKQKLPQMPGVKHSQSNQLITQQKFYSTARDKFQQLGTKKFNAKSMGKNIGQLSRNSSQNQLHRASAGIKLNTFDHISQITQGKRQSELENQAQSYPHFTNQNQKMVDIDHKGKILKSIPKNKEKQNFLTKQTSSRGRQMSRSSRKINEERRINQLISGNKKMLNSASANGNLNSLSKKSKNFRSKKKQNISNSKSKEKYPQSNKLHKVYLRKQQQSSQEQKHSSQNDSQTHEFAQESHDNSQSLTNNFLSPQSGKHSSVDMKGKSSSRVKKGYERSIGDMKDWKEGDGQNQVRRVKEKPGRRLVSKNKQGSVKNKWRKSFDQQDSNVVDRQDERDLYKQRVDQSAESSQRIIVTTQQKLSKSSKLQRQKQLQKKKKSLKNQKNQEDNQTERYQRVHEHEENNVSMDKIKNRANNKVNTAKQVKRKINGEQTALNNKVKQRAQQNMKKLKVNNKSQQECSQNERDDLSEEEMNDNHSGTEEQNHTLQQQEIFSSDSSDLSCQIDNQGSSEKQEFLEDQDLAEEKDDSKLVTRKKNTKNLQTIQTKTKRQQKVQKPSKNNKVKQKQTKNNHNKQISNQAELSQRSVSDINDSQSQQSDIQQSVVENQSHSHQISDTKQQKANSKVKTDKKTKTNKLSKQSNRLDQNDSSKQSVKQVKKKNKQVKQSSLKVAEKNQANTIQKLLGQEDQLQFKNQTKSRKVKQKMNNKNTKNIEKQVKGNEVEHNDQHNSSESQESHKQVESQENITYDKEQNLSQNQSHYSRSYSTNNQVQQNNQDDKSEDQQVEQNQKSSKLIDPKISTKVSKSKQKKKSKQSETLEGNSKQVSNNAQPQRQSTKGTKEQNKDNVRIVMEKKKDKRTKDTITQGNAITKQKQLKIDHQNQDIDNLHEESNQDSQIPNEVEQDSQQSVQQNKGSDAQNELQMQQSQSQKPKQKSIQKTKKSTTNKVKQTNSNKNKTNQAKKQTNSSKQQNQLNNEKNESSDCESVERKQQDQQQQEMVSASYQQNQEQKVQSQDYDQLQNQVDTNQQNINVKSIKKTKVNHPKTIQQMKQQSTHQKKAKNNKNANQLNQKNQENQQNQPYENSCSQNQLSSQSPQEQAECNQSHKVQTKQKKITPNNMKSNQNTIKQSKKPKHTHKQSNLAQCQSGQQLSQQEQEHDEEQNQSGYELNVDEQNGQQEKQQAKNNQQTFGQIKQVSDGRINKLDITSTKAKKSSKNQKSSKDKINTSSQQVNTTQKEINELSQTVLTNNQSSLESDKINQPQQLEQNSKQQKSNQTVKLQQLHEPTSKCYQNNQLSPLSNQTIVQKRQSNTSRTSRNKILNVYDTDRCNQVEDEDSQLIGNGQQQQYAKQPKQQGQNQEEQHQGVELLSTNQQKVKNDQQKTGTIQQQKEAMNKEQSIEKQQLQQSIEKQAKLNQQQVDQSLTNNQQQLSQTKQEQLLKQNNNQTIHHSTLQRQKPAQQQTKVRQSSQPQLELQKVDSPRQIAKKQSIFSKQKQQQESAQEQILVNKTIRAPITKQFYGQSFVTELKRYPNYQSNTHSLQKSLEVNLHSTIPPQSYISYLHQIQPNPTLFNPKSIQVHKLHTNHPLTNLIKCIKILAQINQFLIIRLFENPFVKLTPKILTDTVFGVWLCINYEWRCVMVDLKEVLLSQQNNKPYYLQHDNNQLWPIVLQIALAKALESYQKLAHLPCHKLFNILTGSNSLFFNIKQDPTKNGRILRYINDCENKNFVLHAEKVCKNLQQLENKDKQAKIFYVLSQRTVNENDVLLEIRDSSKQQSQWIRLAKFVQEFRSIEILQLRINHNFSQITLPKPISAQNVTILSLEFSKESFGSITLSTQSHSTSLLKTFLYKEEKSNYLKLVGQAQEKNKSTLFFDCCFNEGKYWLFVECATGGRVTYLGEDQPVLQVVQQVESDGLRNDWTEYLPVKMKTGVNKVNKQTFTSSLGFRMPSKMTKSKFGQTGTSFRSQEDKISKLRQTFVDYLLKGKD